VFIIPTSLEYITAVVQSKPFSTAGVRFFNGRTLAETWTHRPVG
jgi:hypothetical protein